MKIFDREPKKGMPVSNKTMLAGLLRMARAWEKLSVHNGHVDWANGIPTIVNDLYGDSGSRTELDGSITDSDGIDFSLLGADRITVDWIHLGQQGSTTETTLAENKYWLEIDLTTPNSSTVASAVTIESGAAWPTKGGTPDTEDKLIWKLCEIDSTATKAKLYRGAWTDVDGSANIHLRFSSVTAPDVPIGTIRLWNLATYVPLGWQLDSTLEGRVPAGMIESPDWGTWEDDFDALTDTGGNRLHGAGTNDHGNHDFDLSHHHGAGGAKVSAGSYESDDPTSPDPCYNITPPNAQVDDWTDDTGTEGEDYPDADDKLSLPHGSTDNWPPYRVKRFIVRTAIT